MFHFLNTPKTQRILKYLAIFIVLAASLLSIKDEILWQIGYYDNLLSESEDFTEEGSTGAYDQDCNIGSIELHGFLTTYVLPQDSETPDESLLDQVASQDIVAALKELEKDETIKAIILEIDSYGGTPVAAEEVAKALKRVEKPTVALIREGGISAAYWAGTGADIIFASASSDVGGIGVTMSYLDKVKKNQKEGLGFNQLISAEFKDLGDPDKPLTPKEKNILMRDVKILHENFIKAVAENRGLDLEKVRQLADGASVLGEMALGQGLIDKIGGLYEVKEYLKEEIGEAVEICWY